jgi:hypothetical protein
MSYKLKRRVNVNKMKRKNTVKGEVKNAMHLFYGTRAFYDEGDMWDRGALLHGRRYFKQVL